MDLAEYRRKQLKSAGMKAVRNRGAVIFLTYAIDIAVAVANFPLIGVGGFARMGRNLAWGLISVFGAELSASMFMQALAELHASPRVEVVND